MTLAASDGATSGAIADAGPAVARGIAAFAAVGALAVAIGLGEFAASGGAYHWWTWVKVGALYLVSFFGASAKVAVGGKTLFVLHLPLIAGTALAGWMLARAGRWVAAAPGRMSVRAAGVVVGFSVPVAALGLAARLRFPDLGGPGVDATLRAIPWEVLAFPVTFAAGVVAVGAWWARVPAGSVRAIAAGGWKMWWLALVLSFAGLLVAASVRSDRTAQYAGWLGAQGTGGALLFGHQLLAAPNQALFVLAPSMGGSTTVGVVDGDGSTTVSLAGIGGVGYALPGVPRGYPPRRLGGPFYLLLLAPVAATVGGGWSAARGASSIRTGLVRGAGAGVVFGGLVSAVSLVAFLQAPLSRAGDPLRIGPSMPSTALLALSWGIGGGLLGSLAGWFGARYAPGDGEVDVDPPLSPTSV